MLGGGHRLGDDPLIIELGSSDETRRGGGFNKRTVRSDPNPLVISDGSNPSIAVASALPYESGYCPSDDVGTTTSFNIRSAILLQSG